MQNARIVSALSATALGLAGLTATSSATATPSTTGAAQAPAKTFAVSDDGNYVVLAEKGNSAKDLAARLAKKGAKVTSTNEAVGLVTVSTQDKGFIDEVREMDGVFGAASEGLVGRSPEAKDKDSVERPSREQQGAPASGKGQYRSNGKGNGVAADPLDAKLWGMDMINAPEAQRIESGDKRVKVGVMDTGVDGTHPDIAPNFDHKLSRNFTTDMPDVDGPCEVESCVDAADVDENGHGTHVAGTIGAAANGLGLSGVAPDVSLVNVRAGQDSGYFFVGPTVNALTYSADAGLDVVNMSFYVDPWAYNCIDGAPEDSPEEAAEQNMIIESMSRALEYAHDNGVTLVGALGNGHTDLASPGTDTTSPDYPPNNEHLRTIDNSSCFDLPVEGPHVIGVSSVGPSERKSYFSNYTTEPDSGEIEVSAPGGDYRDFFGTEDYGQPGNLILSSVPENVVKAEGSVDADGNITEDGEGWVIKDCDTVRGEEVCGYYEYYQGTSMASPHAAGVAALIVSRYGSQGPSGFGLAAEATREQLMSSARDKACPEGGVQTYPDASLDYTATCVGDEEFNGFYGDGIVDAYAAVAEKPNGQRN